MIYLAAQYFFLQVAAGLAILTFLVSFRSLTFSFYQLHLTAAFAFAVFALWGSGAPMSHFLGGGEVAFFGWSAGQAARLVHGLTLAAAVALLAATVLYSTRWRAPFVLHAAGATLLLPALWLLALGLGARAQWPLDPSSALLLFAVNAALAASTATLATIAMNVGHWYLVNQRLGAHHLGDISAWLLGALVLRGAFLLPSLVVATRALVAPQAPLLDAGLDFIIGGRLVVGYLAPLLLAWMAFQTARIRSTQSATGLLYALLILVIIGEALGAFLTVTRGMPW